MIAARAYSCKLGHEMCSLGDNAAAFVYQKNADARSEAMRLRATQTGRALNPGRLDRSRADFGHARQIRAPKHTPKASRYVRIGGNEASCVEEFGEIVEFVRSVQGRHAV